MGNKRNILVPNTRVLKARNHSSVLNRISTSAQISKLFSSLRTSSLRQQKTLMSNTILHTVHSAWKTALDMTPNSSQQAEVIAYIYTTLQKFEITWELGSSIWKHTSNTTPDHHTASTVLD